MQSVLFLFSKKKKKTLDLNKHSHFLLLKLNLTSWCTIHPCSDAPDQILLIKIRIKKDNQKL